MISKAVRKLVRTIIEKNGGDGREIKKHLDANYSQGIVWWNDCRVGEWQASEERMKLLGEAASYVEHFNNLMGL
eukprot:6321711-Karenia_brevis.AAC.1